MVKIQFIYFEGCPNAEKVCDRLKSLNIDFQKIEQTSLPSESAYKAYSSPSILMNDQLIFGSKTDGQAGGCSLELPSKDELIKKIDQARKGRI